jgi:hypothetical protein
MVLKSELVPIFYLSLIWSLFFLDLINYALIFLNFPKTHLIIVFRFGKFALSKQFFAAKSLRLLSYSIVGNLIKSIFYL